MRSRPGRRPSTRQRRNAPPEPRDDTARSERSRGRRSGRRHRGSREDGSLGPSEQNANTPARRQALVSDGTALSCRTPVAAIGTVRRPRLFPEIAPGSGELGYHTRCLVPATRDERPVPMRCEGGVIGIDLVASRGRGSSNCMVPGSCSRQRLRFAISRGKTSFMRPLGTAWIGDCRVGIGPGAPSEGAAGSRTACAARAGAARRRPFAGLGPGSDRSGGAREKRTVAQDLTAPPTGAHRRATTACVFSVPAHRATLAASAVTRP